MVGFMTCFPIAGVPLKESQIATASVLIQVKNNRVKIDMLLPLAEGASRYVAARLASMMTATQPFPFPRQPPPMLARIHQYWKTLIRAENPMPFSDDVSLG